MVMGKTERKDGLTAKQRKIYEAILKAFPATSKESAYDHAINDGVKFQFRPS